MPDTPESFALWFYNTFIQPLLDLLKEYYILGFSLWEWLILMSVSQLAIKVIWHFFQADTPTKWKD